MTGTGGTIVLRQQPDVCPSDGSFGASSAAAEPVALYTPAYGAGIPPNVSHGEALGASSAFSSAVAAAALIELGPLPPSM